MCSLDLALGHAATPDGQQRGNDTADYKTNVADRGAARFQAPVRSGLQPVPKHNREHHDGYEDEECDQPESSLGEAEYSSYAPIETAIDAPSEGNDGLTKLGRATV